MPAGMLNIAFANELSILCDKFGIDVWELISLANRHPRINILNPEVVWEVTALPLIRGLLLQKAVTRQDNKDCREINNSKPLW
jgi:UDP-N-acetyl-D-mannosaminuronic acid dehydrogenase